MDLIETKLDSTPRYHGIVVDVRTDTVRLPDGRHVALAVFLCNSLESPETNLSLIKDITRLSVDWLARQPMLLHDAPAARP